MGYAATMTAVITAAIMDGKNENLWMAILVALAIGLVVGGLNGALAAYVKLPPLVVTLAMSSILQGAINVYTAGRNITGRPSPVLQIIAAKSIGIFPNILFVLLDPRAPGHDPSLPHQVGPEAVRRGHQRNGRLPERGEREAGALHVVPHQRGAGEPHRAAPLGNMGIAFKDMGSNYVMPSIAAAVVGGVSLTGGDGNYLGVILGAIFLQTLTNLLVALGWGDAGKWLGFGVVLFILLIVYVSNRRSK